ncbi:hypothetical protein [Candidatus Pelagibacter sp. HIMB1709]|uniref:hypothetical protein n=1 Tax=Candidatus Pelagibacter sp. HIMB1709 TaxID=3413367 RepID=UPI003F87DA3F
MLFFIVFAYQAQAEEEGWTIDEFSDFVVTAKHGEVIHGDKLRFFIKKNDCSRMGILFSFSTSIENQNINKLQDARIPIEINGRKIDGAAEVILVQPLFRSMNLVMMQAPGLKHIGSMISSMMAWYDSENYFGIELVSGPNFNPDDYFDILRNNWKLEGLPQKIAEAQSICRGPDDIKNT